MFIYLTNILTDIYGIKSTGSSKISILDIWGLGVVLTQFCSFLTHKQENIRKTTLRISIAHLTLNDMFGSGKPVVDIRVHIFGI